MAWIKFEKDLLTDPRVLRMAKALDARHKIIANPILADDSTDESVSNAQALPAVTMVCGALVRIWSLADTHVDANDVLPLGFEDLNKLVGVPGFCQLMPFEWIEEIDRDSVKLPNYHAHNGTEAKRKAVTQKRVAAFRARNAPALPDQTKTRPRPEEEKGARKLALPGWLPLESWKAWLEVRTKIKAPNTERALKLALADLERLKASGQDPTTVLDNATKRGWRGLFAAEVVAKPVPVEGKKKCSYCDRPATASPNRTPACDEHFTAAMHHEPVKAA